MYAQGEEDKMTRIYCVSWVAGLALTALLAAGTVAQENSSDNKSSGNSNGAPQTSGDQQGASSNSSSSGSQSQNSSTNGQNGQSAGSSNSGTSESGPALGGQPNSNNSNDKEATESDKGAPATSSNTNNSSDSNSNATESKSKSNNSASNSSAENNNSTNAQNDQSDAKNSSRNESRATGNQSRDHESSNTSNSSSANRSSDRSVLTNRNEKDSRRESQASNSDNRNRSTANRNSRNFRNDFKFGKVSQHGLTINTITHNSIFYRSGLRDGDVIVSYAGRPIRSEDDFYRFAVYQPGERVPVVVWRDGREETIYVVYEEDGARDAAARTTGGHDLLGAEFDPDSKNGAVVIRVQEGSPAHHAGLMENDVVVTLNGDEVRSGRDAIAMVEALQAGDRIDIEFTRFARTQAVLGGNSASRDIEQTSYRSDDRKASVAVGVGTDETRRAQSPRNRTDNENRDRDRSENRRENRGILPRLRN